MTPYQILQVYHDRVKYRNREIETWFELQLSLEYTNAGLQRAKKMPTFKSLLKKLRRKNNNGLASFNDIAEKFKNAPVFKRRS